MTSVVLTSNTILFNSKVLALWDIQGYNMEELSRIAGTQTMHVVPCNTRM